MGLLALYAGKLSSIRNAFHPPVIDVGHFLFSISAKFSLSLSVNLFTEKTKKILEFWVCAWLREGATDFRTLVRRPAAEVGVKFLIFLIVNNICFV